VSYKITNGMFFLWCTHSFGNTSVFFGVSFRVTSNLEFQDYDNHSRIGLEARVPGISENKGMHTQNPLVESYRQEYVMQTKVYRTNFKYNK